MIPNYSQLCEGGQTVTKGGTRNVKVNIIRFDNCSSVFEGSQPENRPRETITIHDIRENLNTHIHMLKILNFLRTSPFVIRKKSKTVIIQFNNSFRLIKCLEFVGLVII